MVGVIGASKEKSIVGNFLLSLSYVLGMALVFSILGVFAAFTGKLFGQIQSSPIAHLIVGNVIIIFALSLLDVIPLPTAFLSRAGAGKVVRGGGKANAFFMGLASGLIAAPCASAVLGALLVYVATEKNPFFGFTLLFCYAIGLGLVLILIGTFTGAVSKIPRSEKVMKIIQKVLAFAMILLGEYFIFRAGMLSL